MRLIHAALPLIALAVAAAAPAAKPPLRKAGLWEQTQTMTGIPNLPPQAARIVSTVCTNPAVEARMGAFSGGQTDCSQTAVTPRPGGYAFNTVCGKGAQQTRISGVASGDFNKGYNMDVSVSSGGRPALKMKATARYLGPCKPGQRPGDMTMANGIKVNLMDMAATPPPPRPR